MDVHVNPLGSGKLLLIETLDLQPIAFKLQQELGWSLDQINHATKQYRLWLKMVAHHPEESIIPNKEVDKVWHMHILDTRKYAEDCDKIFGRFLHHFPYFGMRGEEDREDLHAAFARSQEMMLDEFGANLRPYRRGDAEGALCGPENCEPSIYTNDRRPRLLENGMRLVA